MSTRTKLWLVPALLYAAFFYWYTDFGGPLSDTEVDQFIATMKSNGSGTEVIAFVEKFARQDSGRQFLMVNNIDMNENPPDVEGAEPGESASGLMARYMEHMIPALLARACHPALMGSAVYPAMDLVGIEGAENWDQAALDKTIAYPIETSLYLGDPRLLLGLILLALTALTDLWRSSRRPRD